MKRKTKSNRVRSPRRYDEDYVKHELNDFIENVADLDDLARLFSFVTSDRQVIVHDSTTDEPSDVFKHGKLMGTAPKEIQEAIDVRLADEERRRKREGY